jgi:hypothetical protein
MADFAALYTSNVHDTRHVVVCPSHSCDEGTGGL